MITRQDAFTIAGVTSMFLSLVMISVGMASASLMAMAIGAILFPIGVACLVRGSHA